MRQLARKSIAYALEHGINFIDTANIYNKGRSEEIVGQALKELRKRERIVLATKVHVQMDSADPNSSNNHRRHIIEQCHASLKRLQTDYIADALGTSFRHLQRTSQAF